MIFSELKAFLTINSDPEFTELLSSVNDVLIKHGVDEYLDEADGIVYANTDITAQTVIDNLTDFYFNIVTDLLTKYRVQLFDEVLLSEATEVLNGLFDITDYSDKQLIQYLINSDIDSTELVCSLLQLTTSFNLDKLFTLIKSVDDSFTNNLSETLIQQTETPDTDSKMLLIRVNEYKKYKLSVNNEELYSDKYVQNVASIGLDYMLYLQSYISDNVDISNIDIYKIAKDLVGLRILAASDNKPIKISIRDSLNLLTHDANLSTKIDIALSLITANYSNQNA